MTTILKMQRNNSYYFHLFPHPALSALDQSGPAESLLSSLTIYAFNTIYVVNFRFSITDKSKLDSKF